MATTGELGLELNDPLRAVLILGAGLRGAVSTSCSVLLTWDMCFCLSCSATAAYRRSISAWARSRSISIVLLSMVVGELIWTGVWGWLPRTESFVPSFFLKPFLNQEVAERAERGDARAWPLGLAVTSSSSRVLGTV